MLNQSHYKANLEEKGFDIIPNVYTKDEVNLISEFISINQLKLKENLLKSKDLFAIRQVLLEMPELAPLVFTDKLKSIIKELENKEDLFLSKAIYFDKPKESNWFVGYHQDLTINVSDKVEMNGFNNWTNKKGQIGVQPPINYLESTVTIRIHLDDTNESNGALRVIPGSHKKGVIRVSEVNTGNSGLSCNLEKGGVMLMKPLTLHASRRSSGNKKRRVIHLEFCDIKLPEPMKWKERIGLY